MCDCLVENFKMIDKIKAFWGQVKDVLIYILAPIAFFLGIIYHLVGVNRALEDQLSADKRKAEEKKFATALKEAEDDNAEASGDYESVRSSYLKSNGLSEGSELPSSNQGSRSGPGGQGPGN